MKPNADLAVVGGGASGLACAIGLKRRLPDAAVTVYEKLAEPGKKILATGNGRCNLTNRTVDISFYNGDSAVLSCVLRSFGPNEAARFFDSLGLITTEEDGRIYPLSMNASAVRTVLLREAKRLGVRFQTETKIESLEKNGAGFLLNGRYSADGVILAPGGKAASAFGTDGDGYRLLKQLGIRYTPISPALVQLTTEGEKASRLRGIRVRGIISLLREDGTPVGRENGEIQFTDYGLSGIASMQLSGDAAVLVRTEHPTAEIDLCPGLTVGEVRLFLEDRKPFSKGCPVTALTAGMLAERVSEEVLRDAGIPSDRDASSLSDRALDKLAQTIKQFSFRVTGTKGFRNAQVTRGGIPSSELREGSLESRRVPGLFFCGEILNVDGLCGGYNLHFAWGSGLEAAKEVALVAQNQ